MTVLDEAKLAVGLAAHQEFGQASMIYRSALDKNEPPMMVVVMFQDRLIDAVQVAGLESNKAAFDNLVRFAYSQWEPHEVWKLICTRLVRVACGADQAGKVELVRATRQMVLRSRPPGISKYEAKIIFAELTGIGNLGSTSLVHQEVFAS